ncbi:CoA transferase [bacterium]|nr:MAG: CoA transferase [bacterium]
MAEARRPGRPLGGVHGPFSGFERLSVLDFTKLLPGPYATQMLADLGCRVTKVELPHFPDGARDMPPLVDGVGSLYWMVNQGKRELPLDFRKPAGLAEARRLVAEADVLVEGFRPGLMDRVGLGAEEALRLNPRLIYCSLVGYPTAGPWRRKAGHDLNFLAVSGFLGLSAPGQRPAMPPTQVADLTGAMGAVTAILAALLERHTTGKGRRVEVSMAETAHSLLPVALGELRAQGTDPGAGGRWWDGSHPFYRFYQASDGAWLAVAALERPFALSLLEALGLGALAPLADDPAANAARLSEALEGAFKAAPAAAWAERLADKDVCVTPVNRLPEAGPFLERLKDPTGG